MDLERVLADLKLVLDGVLDATADLWVPLRETMAAMPDWALAAAAAGAIVLFFVLLAGGRRLRGDPVDRHAPLYRPTGGAADAAMDRDADMSAPMPLWLQEEPEDEAPEIQGLAEILAAHGLDTAGRDGRLKTFAGELDDLRARLEKVQAGSATTAQLLHEARDAIAAGDLARGTTLLTRVAEEEEASGQGLSHEALVRGRAAALARLVAGDLLAAGDQPEEAAQHYRRAAEAAPESDPELRVECLNRLGVLAHGRGDAATARDAFAAALKTMETAQATTHPDLGGVLNNLGLACDELGDQDAAERHYQRALAADEAAHGDDHLNVAAVLNNLGLLYRRQGKLPAAEPLLRRALAIKEKHLTFGDPGLIIGLVNQAAVLRGLGRDDEAADLESRAGLPPRAPRPEPESDLESETETAARNQDATAPAQ